MVGVGLKRQQGWSKRGEEGGDVGNGYEIQTLMHWIAAG